jgi:ABC-type Zn uptake system ZnuABC Zn-binding protein ZnuA
MRRILTVLAAAAFLLAGCGGGDGAAGDGTLRVVATTTQLGDLARQVGGDRVSVDTLVPANADPHDFEPRPSDVQAVAEADVVLRSGGDLDEWLGEVLDSAGGDAERLTLLEGMRTLEGDGETDPHWWQDPRNAERAVQRIRDSFAAADPAGRAAYATQADRSAGRIRALDAAIASCFEGIAPQRRKLVTNHDAFGYFAARYDIEVLGSIVPALSTAAQPSAGDVRRLVAAIRRERVRTIFPESGVGQRLERAVAEEAGARVGPALYADTLGPEGSPGATYLGALRHDAAAMAEGFGGDCRLP